MTIASAAPNASHAPVSGSRPVAAGGGLRISATTSTNTASTEPGSQRLSTSGSSGATRPAAAASASSARAASSTSATSNTVHAFALPYHSRNRLTSSTRLPRATISGPISNRLITYR